MNEFKGQDVMNGRLSMWLIGAMFTILTTSLAMTVKAVVDNDRRSIERHMEIMGHLGQVEGRLSKIEGNRFTSSDANHLIQNMMDKLPPQWLIDRVKKNEDRLDQLDKHIRDKKI